MKRTPFGVRFTPALTSCPPAETRIEKTSTPTRNLCNTKNARVVELAAKRADAGAWEREIDQLVYRLYGLTPEEIKIVEEGTK